MDLKKFLQSKPDLLMFLQFYKKLAKPYFESKSKKVRGQRGTLILKKLGLYDKKQEIKKGLDEIAQAFNIRYRNKRSIAQAAEAILERFEKEIYNIQLGKKDGDNNISNQKQTKQKEERQVEKTDKKPIIKNVGGVKMEMDKQELQDFIKRTINDVIENRLKEEEAKKKLTEITQRIQELAKKQKVTMKEYCELHNKELCKLRDELAQAINEKFSKITEEVAGKVYEKIAERLSKMEKDIKSVCELYPELCKKIEENQKHVEERINLVEEGLKSTVKAQKEVIGSVKESLQKLDQEVNKVVKEVEEVKNKPDYIDASKLRGKYVLRKFQNDLIVGAPKGVNEVKAVDIIDSLLNSPEFGDVFKNAIVKVISKNPDFLNKIKGVEYAQEKEERDYRPSEDNRGNGEGRARVDNRPTTETVQEADTTEQGSGTGNGQSYRGGDRQVTTGDRQGGRDTTTTESRTTTGNNTATNTRDSANTGAKSESRTNTEAEEGYF